MNTYQRQLLDKLISELTDKQSPFVHVCQMLAAELKGALGITPMMTLDTETGKVTPTTDDDGWVAHTSGKRPYGQIAEVKFRRGNIDIDSPYYNWVIKGLDSDITHYRPV